MLIIHKQLCWPTRYEFIEQVCEGRIKVRRQQLVPREDNYTDKNNYVEQELTYNLYAIEWIGHLVMNIENDEDIEIVHASEINNIPSTKWYYVFVSRYTDYED